jgi:hypothetical protein
VLVRNRARAATLHFDLCSLESFRMPPGLGPGLGFAFEPRGIFAACLPFGSLCREVLRGLASPR